MDAAADDIVFRPAWRLNDPQVVRDAMAVWARENIIQSVTDERVKELCAVAYSGGEPVAVSTATIIHAPSLRNNFFNYRCIVASHFRQRDMAWKISAYSFMLLQDWSLHNPQERVLGFMIYVETDKFAVPQRDPVREHLGITLHFVGYTPNGQQVRVVWFNHAKLEDNTGGG